MPTPSPIQITQLLALDGPNRYRPQPGVYALAHGARDLPALTLLLKDAAQRVGVVLAHLHVEPVAGPHGSAAEIQFSTPTPALGAALVRHAVDALQAQAQGDDSWDADGQLLDLQRRRRAEALPIAALQILAEAAARQIPAFVRADGAIQIGYGARGVRIPIAHSVDLLRADSIGVAGQPPRTAAAPDIAWDQLGSIPILATVGMWGVDRGAGPCGFDQARAALSDPAAASLILALDPHDLATRGLPFERCQASVIFGLPDIPGSRAERAQIAGLPLLVTAPGGLAILDAETPEIAALADYAPCPIIWATRDTRADALAAALAQIS